MYSARKRLWHPTQQIHALPDGIIELHLTAGGMFELTRWILGLGQAAEVIEPPQLRKSVQSAVERVAATYKSREVV
jgi:predicted DNA-binding transcriptional regulator YafY